MLLSIHTILIPTNKLDIPDQDNWEQDEAPPANYYRTGKPNAN
jgi:hypothetical protein